MNLQFLSDPSLILTIVSHSISQFLLLLRLDWCAHGAWRSMKPLLVVPMSFSINALGPLCLWQWLAVFLNFRKYLIYRFALIDLKLLRHYGRQLRWRQWRDGQGRWWRLMRENGTTRESWWADGLFRRRILARPELRICPFPRKQMWKGKISFISNFWDVKMMMAWKRVCRFFRQEGHSIRFRNRYFFIAMKLFCQVILCNFSGGLA